MSARESFVDSPSCVFLPLRPLTPGPVYSTNFSSAGQVSLSSRPLSYITLERSSLAGPTIESMKWWYRYGTFAPGLSRSARNDMSGSAASGAAPYVLMKACCSSAMSRIIVLRFFRVSGSAMMVVEERETRSRAPTGRRECDDART